jgi:chromosome segregation ATPase
MTANPGVFMPSLDVRVDVGIEHVQEIANSVEKLQISIQSLLDERKSLEELFRNKQITAEDAEKRILVLLNSLNELTGKRDELLIHIENTRGIVSDLKLEIEQGNIDSLKSFSIKYPKIFKFLRIFKII